MKKYNFLFILSLVAAVIFSSCDDKEMLTFNPDNTVASDLSGPASIALDVDAADEALTFTWTDAQYDVNVEVNYVLNLSTPDTMVQLYSGSGKSFSVSIGDLNTMLLNQLEQTAGEDVDLTFSQLSVINEHVDNVAGNSLMYTVQPYETDFPPIYMVGAATGGWNWDSEIMVPSVAPNKYSTKAHFLNGESFRFFAQQDWGPTSYNYPHFESGSISSLFENAEDGDKNFRFTGETGWYQVTVSLKDLTVELVKVDEPSMFMTGAGVGGWDWSDNFVKMNFVQEGVFTIETEFIKGEAFRFFGQQDWGPTSYNYPFFDAGFVSALFENAEDGDSNFRVVGETGMYTVTINLNEPVSVKVKGVDDPKMFMTGAAVGGWDWNENFVEMEWMEEGIWKVTTEFISGEAFRFFGQQDWSPTSYNYPFFPAGSVSNLFENAGDGDSNFKFTGTTGEYTVTINLNDPASVSIAE